MSWRSEELWWKKRPTAYGYGIRPCTPRTSPARPRRHPPEAVSHATTSPWSAAAPPACTWRSRPPPRAPESRSSPASRWPRARAIGPRAGSLPRSPPTTRPRGMPRTRSTPAAGSASRQRSRCSSRRPPPRSTKLVELGVELRPQRERRGRARARGRPLGPPDRPRRRRLDRQGDHPLPRRARRRGAADRRCSRPVRRPPCCTMPRAVTGSPPTRGPYSPRRRSSRPAAAQRCGAGRRTPGAPSPPAPPWRAAVGAELGGLELCQFHPTALAAPGNPLDGRLITEAVRGEGAVLLDAAGHRFTDELAPRDQVTAAILDRIDADGTGHVGLDLRDVPLERFADDRRDARPTPASIPPASPFRSPPPPTI